MLDKLSHLIKYRIYSNLSGEDLISVYKALGERSDLSFYMEKYVNAERLSVKSLVYFYVRFFHERLHIVYKKVNWDKVLCEEELDMEFLDNIRHKLMPRNLCIVCKRMKLPDWYLEKLIKKYKEYEYLIDVILDHQYLSEELLSKFEKDSKLLRELCNERKDLSDDFISRNLKSNILCFQNYIRIC